MNPSRLKMELVEPHMLGRNAPSAIKTAKYSGQNHFRMTIGWTVSDVAFRSLADPDGQEVVRQQSY
jgi:hypothetical protein